MTTPQPFRRLLLAALLFAGAGAQAQTAPTLSAAWARPTVEGQAAGGGYLTITGGSSADRLLSARSPVAKAVELHTMAMEGDVMRMRPIASIEVPAGRTVALKPGGMHVMFVGLVRPLASGTRIPLTLRFEKAGEVAVEMLVATQPPASAASAMPAR